MAQEQMARMSPEQMAEMQKVAANMDPSMAARMGVDPAYLRNAGQAMQNMTPEDMARASEEVRAARGGRLRGIAQRRLSRF